MLGPSGERTARALCRAGLLVFKVLRRRKNALPKMCIVKNATLAATGVWVARSCRRMTLFPWRTTAKAVKCLTKYGGGKGGWGEEKKRRDLSVCYVCHLLVI